MAIPKLKSDRFKVLQEFYKNYEKKGDQWLDTSSDEFKKATGLNENDIALAMDYFRDSLIEMDESNTIGLINSAGIEEYESTMENPDAATVNFPAQIYNIINSTFNDSQIQQGTFHSSQTLSITNKDLKDIRKLFSEIEINYNENIREGLEEVAQNILDDNLKDTREEIEKEKPLYDRLKEKVKVLKGNIELIALASTLVQSQILPLIHELWKLFEK